MHILQGNTCTHAKDSLFYFFSEKNLLKSITYSAANTLVRYLRCLSRLKRTLEGSCVFPCSGKPPELETMVSSSCPKSKLVSPSVPFGGSFSTWFLFLSTTLLVDVARTLTNVSTIHSIKAYIVMVKTIGKIERDTILPHYDILISTEMGKKGMMHIAIA